MFDTRILISKQIENENENRARKENQRLKILTERTNLMHLVFAIHAFVLRKYTIL